NYQKWDSDSLFCIWEFCGVYGNRLEFDLKKMRDARTTSRQTEATEAISHYLNTGNGKAVALPFEALFRPAWRAFGSEPPGLWHLSWSSHPTRRSFFWANLSRRCATLGLRNGQAV